MAFPSITGTVTQTNGSTASANKTINLPASIAVGETVIAILFTVSSDNTSTWPAGWNELFDGVFDTRVSYSVAWHKGTGTEGSTISVTQATSVRFAGLCWRVTNAADPDVTPPQVSAIAQLDGDTPNPNTLSPTGGAKDYLWIWSGGWRGEQTSPPTGNPTNYGSNVTGADSGVSGNVDTNCRVAIATRQLNAATEDPPSWTISAVNRWMAITIAVHPADVNPTKQTDWPNPLIKTKINPDWVQSRPQYYQDPRIEAIQSYDLPLPRKAPGLTHINSNVLDTLAPIVYPFNQLDWPNPLIPGRLITEHSSWVSSSDAFEAFKPIDWRNPDLLRRQNLGFVSSILPNLTPPEQVPFLNTFENPKIKSSIFGYIHSKQLDSLGPFKGDNVNPLIGNRNHTGFIFNRKIDEPVEIPFIPIEFRNPDLLKEHNRGFVQARPQHYEDLVPKNQYNWPNPAPKFRPGLTHIDNLNESTLAPIPTDPPIRQNDWPVYQRKPYIIVDINSVAGPDDPGNPVGSSATGVLKLKNIINLGWTQNRPLYYQDTKPFNQLNWNNPELKKKSAITHIHTRQIPSVVENPFTPIIYPNPLVKKGIALGWTYFGNLQQIFTSPIAFGNVSETAPRKRINPVGWIQARPSYYVESLQTPISNAIWPVPGRLHNGLIVDISTRYTVSDFTAPFNQKDWPNPRRKGMNPGWIDYFVIDDNQPPINSIFLVPQVKKLGSLGFIDSRVISESNVLNIFEYPNPKLKGRETESWIVNLLQSTLDPGAGAVPFNQNDYPNPLIATKLLHSGWIFDKPTYYTEEPLQPAQYDWPIYRALIRNVVGFIKTVIPPEDNRFTSVTELPVVRVKRTEGFIDSIIIPVGIVPGLKPFSQNEWSNPIRKKWYDIYTINGANYLVLPQVVGRRICLLAGLTEFELEAMLEEFDLDAGMTEYDLDAGGTECE